MVAKNTDLDLSRVTGHTCSDLVRRSMNALWNSMTP